MEWKTLVLGIGMSLGVFGIKTGAGLFGGMPEDAGGASRWKIIFQIAAGYALVFAALATCLRAIHLTDHIDALLHWLQAGMIVHVTLAVFMLAWGIGLKRSNRFLTRHRNGWWLLALPCPVCITVIGISMSFLTALFPEAIVKTTALLYAGFMVVVLTTVLALSRWSHSARHPSGEILSTAMLILAAYFLLSILIMPQFAGIEEISRMGAKPGSLHNVDGYGIAGMAGAILVLLAIGYGWMNRQVKQGRISGVSHAKMTCTTAPVPRCCNPSENASAKTSNLNPSIQRIKKVMS